MTGTTRRDSLHECVGLAGMLILMFAANVYAATERRAPTAPHTSLWPRAAVHLVILTAAVFVAVSSQ